MFVHEILTQLCFKFTLCYCLHSATRRFSLFKHRSFYSLSLACKVRTLEDGCTICPFPYHAAFPPSFLYGLYANFDWFPASFFAHILKKPFCMLLSQYFISFLLCFFSLPHCKSITLYSILFYLQVIHSSISSSLVIWRTINSFLCLKVNGFFFSSSLL